MQRLAVSIAKYFRWLDPVKGRAAQPISASCQQRRHGQGGSGHRETPERVLRRPDPIAWSQDELLALHEAVALLWPHGPVTTSTLRSAIASGDLAYARIAGRIYTTRAALAAMTSCERRTAGDGGADAAEGVDWEAHLATLLPKRSGSRT